MSIQSLLLAEAFSPEDAGNIIAAFEDTLAELGLKDQTDPFAEIVARRVIACAKNGVRERIMLRKLTLKTIRG